LVMAPRVRRRREAAPPPDRPKRTRGALTYRLEITPPEDPEVRREAARGLLEWLTRPLGGNGA
jgi:hypothetical protein